MAATTTCFTGVGLHKSCVSNTINPNYVQVARNISTLDIVLAPDTSNRYITVYGPVMFILKMSEIFVTKVYILKNCYCCKLERDGITST